MEDRPSTMQARLGLSMLLGYYLKRVLMSMQELV